MSCTSSVKYLILFVWSNGNTLRQIRKKGQRICFKKNLSPSNTLQDFIIWLSKDIGRKNFNWSTGLIQDLYKDIVLLIFDKSKSVKAETTHDRLKKLGEEYLNNLIYEDETSWAYS